MKKKLNIISIHKTADNETAINYNLLSLLPICGKIFELLYNEMLFFFKIMI